MNKIKPIIYAVLFLLIITVTGSAQQPVADQPLPEIIPRTERHNISRDIQYSRKLLNQKQYDLASAYLEDLYQKYPDNQIVVSLLFQCYQFLDLPLKQEELMRRQIKLHPKNFSYHLSYAEAAARLGNIDEALKRYQKTVELSFANSNYRLIINNILKYNFNQPAKDMIVEIRENKQDSLLLCLEMGIILEREKKYTEAAAEYSKLLADSSSRGKQAVIKISQLLKFEESAGPTEQYLLANGDKISNEQILNLLSVHYLNTNQFETAYQFTLRHDSIRGFQGMIPISFMSRCFNQKLFEQVIKVGEYLDSHYSDNLGVVLTSSVFYGDACYELGKFDRAEKIYRKFFGMSRSVRDKAIALNRIGEIYLKGRADFTTAKPLFDSVITYYDHGAGFQKALLNSPDCYFYQGKFDKAINGYRSVAKRTNLPDEVKEEVAYNLGLLHLFNKQADSAKSVFNKLIVDYNRGYFVNDALKHLLIFDETADAPNLIYDYSNLLYFRKLEKSDSVLTTLKIIASDPSQLLSDMALLEIVREYLKQNDTVNTLGYIDTLEISFDKSYYLPEALKIKADIFLTDAKTKEQGIEIYRLLLEKYPFSPFNEEIREILRELSRVEAA